MEKMDTDRIRRVWQRVQGRAEPDRPALKELARDALTVSRCCARLSRRMPGKSRQLQAVAAVCARHAQQLAALHRRGGGDTEPVYPTPSRAQTFPGCMGMAHSLLTRYRQLSHGWEREGLFQRLSAELAGALVARKSDQ